MEVESAPAPASASKDTRTLLPITDTNTTTSTSTSTSNSSKFSKKKKRLIIGGVVLATVIIFIILGLTVFKAKDPKVTVNSITLDHFSTALNPTRLRVNLNVTIRIDLTLKNPNIIGMEYKNITAFISYRDEPVGELHIPAGKIGAHDTRRMDITLLVLADNLALNPNLYADVIAGSIKFTTVTKISAKVKILKIFTISISATSTCAIVIDVKNKALSGSTCTTET